MQAVQNFLTDLLAQVAESSAGFNLSSATKLSWDIFVILFIFLALFLYGLSAGRNKLVLFIFSTYISFLTIKVFPYWSVVESRVSIPNTFISYSLGFLFFNVLIFLLFSRSGIKTFFSLSSVEKGSWFQIFTFSIIGVGVFISFLLSFFSQTDLEIISPQTVKLFGDDTRIIWLVVSLIILSFSRRHHRFKKPDTY